MAHLCRAAIVGLAAGGPARARVREIYLPHGVGSTSSPARMPEPSLPQVYESSVVICIFRSYENEEYRGSVTHKNDPSCRGRSSGGGQQTDWCEGEDLTGEAGPAGADRAGECQAPGQARRNAARPGGAPPPQVVVLDHVEALLFIETHALMGRGLGYLDIHLLGSARVSDAGLWTEDRSL